MDGEAIPAPAVVVPLLRRHQLCNWTDQEVELLKKLWAEGMSGSRIGAILGTTRNSVIGKSHRLELPRRDARFCGQRKPYVRRMGHHIAKKRRAAPAPRPVSRVVAALNCLPTQPIPQQQPTDIGRKPYTEVEHGECRFPITQPSGQHWACCEKSVPGLPYCEHHARRCYDLSPTKSKESPVFNGHAARVFA